MNVYDIIPRPWEITLTDGYYVPGGEGLYIKIKEYMQEDEYSVEISEKGVKIKAGGEQGVFYAKKTLQLLSTDGRIQRCVIKDKPRFAYRGFMIDSVRHMQTVEEIKTYIEAAALLKFNYFHWHLTDDQGWRIESEKYPLLNTVGSYRKSSDFGSVHTGEPYGGYYTKQQIKDIIEFCRERFITVIPEFELPGHCSAAIASYPYLSCTGEQIEVETRQGIYKNILCPSKETTFEFIRDVLDEITELFPGEYVHIGGDEAPKDRWKACPHCQSKLKELGLRDFEQLQGFLTNRAALYLESKGKQVIVWNESLKSGMLRKNTVVQNWMDKDKLCAPWVNGGGKMIASDFYHYYLDYPYGMTPLNKTLSFDPVIKGIKPENESGVIGVEAPIWTEYVDNFSHMCYMCFPRLAAVAQTAWSTEAPGTDDFAARCRSLCRVLEGMGVTPAPADEWNPATVKRARQVVKFFTGNINGDDVKNFLGIGDKNKRK